MSGKAEATLGADQDWSLLARVGAGDADAFAPIVERHQERVVRLCQRFLGERDEALDAAQEVFLKAFEHAADAEPRGQMFTWLYRIAVNHCLNRLRRRKVVRFLSLAGADDDEQPVVREPRSDAPDAEEQLATRERWQRTRRAIDELPASQRSVLILAKFEGMSYKEIAATLGITPGAVESRLVRAMRRLNAAQGSVLPRVSPRRARA
jgi:RNA polymerase sigma-70 factor (ECF subfamily)